MGSSGSGTGDAVELLRGQGMRMTPQRLAIVDEIMSTSGYVIPTTVIERVRLLGFAAPERGGGYLLTRFNLFCCAADGQAYQLEVRGDRVRRQPDQWLVVEGRWLPQRVYDGIAPSGVRPVLVAESVTPVRAPADPYEHNLYGL